jgi:outer membrane protein
MTIIRGRIKIFQIIILITTVFCSLTQAQKKIFTLDDAINKALRNNREIIIAKMNIEKSEAAVSEAFGYALPSVDVSANFAHFLKKPKTPFPDFAALLGNATYSILFDEGVLPRDNNKFKPVGYSLQSFVLANSYETRVQVTQALFNSAVFKGIGASQIYLDLAKEEYNRITASTILNVKKAFYGVLLTKKLLEITIYSYQNALDNLSNVKALYSQGLVSEFDALQAEVNVENIKPVIQQMENTLKSAMDGLKIVLGVEQNEDIEVEGELIYAKEQIPDEDETVLRARSNNFSIKSLQIKMEVDDAFIDLDRSEYWPSVYAFANYSYAGASDNWNFQNYSSAMVGVTLSMNLFMGHQTKNRVEQRIISLRQTEQQIFQYKDFISTEVKAKINELKRVEQNLEAQERNVLLAEKAYRIAVARYNEGAGSQLEVQNADIALKQAKINRLQSVYDYLIARSSLDELSGVTYKPD